MLSPQAVDSALLESARRSIAREHGLSDQDAPRLVDETGADLHADARAMSRESTPITQPGWHATTTGGVFDAD
jgi:hypothetical protein